MSEISQTDTILEANNFIVLEKYIKSVQASSYQTEADLEKELIADLRQQGYEYLTYLTTPEALLANINTHMEVLNNLVFKDAEWLRVLDE